MKWREAALGNELEKKDRYRYESQGTAGEMVRRAGVVPHERRRSSDLCRGLV